MSISSSIYLCVLLTALQNYSMPIQYSFVLYGNILYRCIVNECLILYIGCHHFHNLGAQGNAQSHSSESRVSKEIVVI